MKRINLRAIRLTMHFLLVAIMIGLVQQSAWAGSAAEIDKEVELALEKLYAGSELAKDFSTITKGMLIFPSVIKAGLVIGGQYGEGALLVNGKTAGYYNTVAASYGLPGRRPNFRLRHVPDDGRGAGVPSRKFRMGNRGWTEPCRGRQRQSQKPDNLDGPG